MPYPLKHLLTPVFGYLNGKRGRKFFYLPNYGQKISQGPEYNNPPKPTPLTQNPIRKKPANLNDPQPQKLKPEQRMEQSPPTYVSQYGSQTDPKADQRPGGFGTIGQLYPGPQYATPDDPDVMFDEPEDLDKHTTEEPEDGE